MPLNYISQHYLNDLRVFHGEDIPQHGSFGMLCGMTMGKLFEPQCRVKFTSPSDFLCCLYELNLIYRGISRYYGNLRTDWIISNPPFIDCGGCSSGHGGWLRGQPNSILRFARDPSYVSGAQPVEITNEQLKGYTQYFLGDHLTKIFAREILDPDELLARLIEDPSSSEVRNFASVPSATMDKMKLIIEEENRINQLKYDEIQRKYDDAKFLRVEKKRRLKEERANRHRERIVAYSSARREAQIEELFNIVDAAKRLEVIAKDCEFAPYYYPGEFADVDTSTLNKLEPELLATLAERLSFAPKGKWLSLRNILHARTLSSWQG